MSILGLNANYGSQTHANSSATKSSNSDYAQSLQEKFNYLNTSTTMSGIPATVSVSPAFIEKCADDPKKAAYLEENLAAIPDSVKSLCSAVKQAPGSPAVTYAAYQIDDNGNITMISGSTNDPDGKIARENSEERQEERKKLKKRRTKKFSVQGKSVRRITEKLIKQAGFSDAGKTSGTSIRKIDYIEISEAARLAFEQKKKVQAPAGPGAAQPDGEETTEKNGGKVAVNVSKRVRQIAAAKSRGEIQRLLALLQGDMADCKAGLENGWCDESEIAKVETLINMAKVRMSQVPQKSDDDQDGVDAFDLASLL